jgi:hypothetical protein
MQHMHMVEDKRIFSETSCGTDFEEIVAGKVRQTFEDRGRRSCSHKSAWVATLRMTELVDAISRGVTGDIGSGSCTVLG